ncbi:MAG: clan AA aspartic protease [Halioglobus sp.]|nr:clan AA aspartic protease [Halioglobus sp.]
MMRIVSSMCLLVTGLMLGWWLHGFTDKAQSFPVQSLSDTAPPSISARAEQSTIIDSGMSPSVLPEMPMRPSAAREFEQLLQQGDYEQSIAYYDATLAFEEQHQAVLKAVLENYLSGRVQACDDESFVDLVDRWLGAYYADIEVLLLLAEYQSNCSSAEEAARTLQIASTYALRPGQRDKVSAAVSRLILATQQRLSGKQQWVDLLGFYEYLDVVDLETQVSQLQRAVLYARTGEVERSRKLLLALQEMDDGLDSGWTATLKRQLARAVSEPAMDDQAVQDEVGLTRRGNHYLVPALLNGVDRIALIIDTGASMTTLSSDSFRRIRSAGMRYLGTQLFNTPNGMTQGKVYRAESIQVGEQFLHDLHIAVLDFETSAAFDGLLGMNVLRNYRFNIDQDRYVLQLAPRG